MKKYFVLITMLLVNISITISQTPEENLKKYWTLRAKLLDYYVVTSPNNEQGSNYPAMSVLPYPTGSGETAYSMNFGDGNTGLQYYIGMLATEYYLLKYYGQDVTETRNYLLWALTAVKRLDATAESYFREDHAKYVSDFNGFSIRCDMDNSDTNIKSINPNSKIINFAVESYYNTYYNGEIHNAKYTSINQGYFSLYPGEHDLSKSDQKDFEQSKDVVWNYLINLALVKKLVNDSEIQSLTLDLAFKMIDYMHSYHGSENGWFIRNPIMSCLVKNGADGRGTVDEFTRLAGLSYGFGRAGGVLTGQNCHYWGSQDLGDSFKAALTNKVLFKNFDYNERFRYFALATIFGYEQLEDDTYDYMRKYSLSSDYILFPLIYSILHDKTKYFSNNAIVECARYENLLNTTDKYGSYYLSDNDHSSNWSSSSYLTDPEQTGFGYFNGIDYMLLHNLNWITNITNINNYYAVKADPVPSGTTDNFNDMIDRDYSCVISSTGTVNLVTGKEIKLTDGFKASSGSTFNAKTKVINYANKEYPIFKRVDPYILTYPFTPIETPNLNYSASSLPKPNNLNSTVPENNLRTKLIIKQDLTITQISPNPSTGLFQVELKGGENNADINIDVVSSQGVQVYRSVVKSSIVEVNLLDKPKGIYILTATGSGKTIRSKIVVK